MTGTGTHEAVYVSDSLEITENGVMLSPSTAMPTLICAMDGNSILIYKIGRIRMVFG